MWQRAPQDRKKSQLKVFGALAAAILAVNMLTATR